jgi:hypothetical protein
MLFAGLLGCQAQPVPGADPTNITLDNALKAVQSGLDGMYDRRRTDYNNNLVPTEVTVELKVTAGGTNRNELVLDASLTGTNPVTTTSLKGTTSSEMTGSRGNTITVKFVNVLTLSKDSYVATKTLEELKQLIVFLREGGTIQVDGKPVKIPPSHMFVAPRPQ